MCIQRVIERECMHYTATVHATAVATATVTATNTAIATAAIATATIHTALVHAHGNATGTKADVNFMGVAGSTGVVYVHTYTYHQPVSRAPRLTHTYPSLIGPRVNGLGPEQSLVAAMIRHRSRPPHLLRSRPPRRRRAYRRLPCSIRSQLRRIRSQLRRRRSRRQADRRRPLITRNRRRLRSRCHSHQRRGHQLHTRRHRRHQINHRERNWLHAVHRKIDRRVGSIGLNL